MSTCLTGRTQIEPSTHTYPHFRFADRLGLGIGFDFRLPDTPPSPTDPTRLHTYPHFRFADRLGLGIDFDFRQPDMPNLRRKICYRLCTYKVPAL